MALVSGGTLAASELFDIDRKRAVGDKRALIAGRELEAVLNRGRTHERVVDGAARNTSPGKSVDQ